MMGARGELVGMNLAISFKHSMPLIVAVGSFCPTLLGVRAAYCKLQQGGLACPRPHAHDL
jgi:hypothetical protein